MKTYYVLHTSQHSADPSAIIAPGVVVVGSFKAANLVEARTLLKEYKGRLAAKALGDGTLYLFQHTGDSYRNA